MAFGSSMIGNLAVNLSMETAAFQRGATKAEARAKVLQGRLGGVASSMKGLGASLGIGIGIGAITTLTANAFEMASSLNEAAQKAGVTVEALQELRVAAQQTGVSEDQLATAMGRLNKSMGELAQGKKGAVDAFAAIGLAAEDLKGKTPEQALRIIADQLNKLPSVQERVAAGSAIMGRSFSQLLPLINGGSAALDKYAQESRKAGQISTEDAKKLDDLADSWDRLKTRVGVATANMIAGTARFLESSDAMVISFWTARDKMIATASGMAASVVASIGSMVSGIRDAITGKLNAIWEGAKERIESVKNKFRDMYEAVVGHSYVPEMVALIGINMGKLQQNMVEPAEDATEATAAAFEEMVKRSPIQQWADTIPKSLAQVREAMESIGARGLDALSDGLTQVIMGAESLGRMFKNVARQMLADIIQLTIRMMLMRAVMSIFPGLGGGAAPGSDIVVTGLPAKLPGFATGGSFTALGRRGSDKNILGLNGTPIARISHGERVSVSNDNTREAQELIVHVNASEDFDVRIERVSSGVVARAAPAIAEGTSRHVFKTLRRPRLG